MQETRAGADLVTGWLRHLEAHGYELNTRKSYGAAANAYLEFLKIRGCRYDSVDLDLLDDWLLWLRHERRMKERSVNGHISAMRTWYAWLKRRGYVWENPVREIRMLRAPKLLPKPIPEGDVMKILAVPKEPIEQALVEVWYASGCRIGETWAMNVGGVDFHKKEILTIGKRRKERIVQIGRHAVRAVRAWLAFRQRRGDLLAADTPLWVSYKRVRLSKKTMRKWFTKVAAAAGITYRVWVHRLRHSCGTHMLDHGADLRTVQELLGHENLSTTQVYTEVSTARLKKEHRRTHPRA